MSSPSSANARRQTAAEIMTAFAERTGITSEHPGRRYLWTDAFAVCNFLGLAESTGDGGFGDLALRLIDRVHHTLGTHRPDDTRTGWISGLDSRGGELHPTRGGLRIGKALPERGQGEPFNERLEWERDGQYFHYLTRWMDALDQATRSTRMPIFNAWARELAETAHRAFVVPSDWRGRRRLYWKMSIDLSRPAVPSTGQHDALDGYVTCAKLQATAVGLRGPSEGPALDDEIADFASMIDRENLGTADPLGLGGLLADAYRLEQLSVPDAELRETLLGSALGGLEQYAALGDVAQPAQRRLAFRELGLAIGLDAVARMRQDADSERGRSNVERRLLAALSRYDPLCAEIANFWSEPAHQRVDTWAAHRDINDVMLATALLPIGFLA